MTAINTAATISAFNAAVAALEQATSVTPERAERLNKILARIEADSILAGKVVNFKTSAAAKAQVFAAGDEVIFNVGRAETRVTGLRGVVIAVREKGEGTQPAVKIRSGSGFDEEVYTVHPGQVALVNQPAQAEVSESDELDALEAQA